VFALDVSQISLPGGITEIDVRISSLTEAEGTLKPWVGAGTQTINGPLTSWRMDVGMGAAFNDPINLIKPVTIINSGVAFFDSHNKFIDRRPLVADGSTATSLAGVASSGNGRLNPDIGGYDLSQIIMAWQVKAVVPEPAAVGWLVLAAGGMLLRHRPARPQ